MRFECGDIVEVVNCPPGRNTCPEQIHNGSVGTVIRPIDLGFSGVYYEVSFPSCVNHIAVFEKCLRKLKPPSDYLKVVSWDDCPWKPEGLRA